MPIVHTERYLSANSTLRHAPHTWALAHTQINMKTHTRTAIGIKHSHSAKLIHWESYVLRTLVAAFIHALTLVSVWPARAGYIVVVVVVVQRPPQSVYTRLYTPCNLYLQQYIQIKQGNLFYTNFISFALHSTATVLCIKPSSRQQAHFVLFFFSSLLIFFIMKRQKKNKINSTATAAAEHKTK